MTSGKQTAFTLIELLVVIAIISLLVTILMPSLQKAKELARNTMCCTNLSGLGKAIYYYVQEFEGTFPVWRQWVDTEVPGSRPTFWYMDVAGVMGWNKTWLEFPPPTPEIIEQWDDPKIFLCPLTDRSEVGVGENQPGWKDAGVSLCARTIRGPQGRGGANTSHTDGTYG